MSLASSPGSFLVVVLVSLAAVVAARAAAAATAAATAAGSSPNLILHHGFPSLFIPKPCFSNKPVLPKRNDAELRMDEELLCKLSALTTAIDRRLPADRQEV